MATKLRKPAAKWKSKWPKCFVHVDGFLGGAKFVRYESASDNGATILDDGRVDICTVDYKTAQAFAREGTWKQIPSTQAEKILKEK